MNSSSIIGRLVASFLETSRLYHPPLLEGEGVGGEIQAEHIKRQYNRVWYNSQRDHSTSLVETKVSRLISYAYDSAPCHALSAESDLLVYAEN